MILRILIFITFVVYVTPLMETIVIPRLNGAKHRVVFSDHTEDIITVDKQVCGIGELIYFCKEGDTPYTNKDLNVRRGVYNQVAIDPTRRIYSGSNVTVIGEDVWLNLSSSMRLPAFSAMVKGQPGGNVTIEGTGVIYQNTAGFNLYRIGSGTTIKIQTGYLCSATKAGVCATSFTAGVGDEFYWSVSGNGLKYYVQSNTTDYNVVSTLIGPPSQFLPRETDIVPTIPLGVYRVDYFRNPLLSSYFARTATGQRILSYRTGEKKRRKRSTRITRLYKLANVTIPKVTRRKRWASISLAIATQAYTQAHKVATEKTFDVADQNFATIKNELKVQSQQQVNNTAMQLSNSVQLSVLENDIVTQDLQINRHGDILAELSSKVNYIERFALESQNWKQHSDLLKDQEVNEYLNKVAKERPNFNLTSYYMTSTQFVAVGHNGKLADGRGEGYQCNNYTCIAMGEWYHWRMAGVIVKVNDSVFAESTCGVIFRGVSESELRVGKAWPSFAKVLLWLKDNPQAEYFYFSTFDCLTDSTLDLKASHLSNILDQLKKNGLGGIKEMTDNSISFDCTVKEDIENKTFQRTVQQMEFCTKKMSWDEVKNAAKKANERDIVIQSLGNAFREHSKNENDISNFIKNAGEPLAEIVGNVAGIGPDIWEQIRGGAIEKAQTYSIAAISMMCVQIVLTLLITFLWFRSSCSDSRRKEVEKGESEFH